MTARRRGLVHLLDLILPDIDGLLLAVTSKQLAQAPIVVLQPRRGQVDHAGGAPRHRASGLTPPAA